MVDYGPQILYTTMAPTTRAGTNWAVDRAASPEVWALVAAFSGLVGVWRMLGVCRAARAGAKEFLGTLPRLVVSGGRTGDGALHREWGLDLASIWTCDGPPCQRFCAHAPSTHAARRGAPSSSSEE